MSEDNNEAQVPAFHDGLFRDHWDSFKTKVIPSEAGRFQRTSMCQAFIGGAMAYRVAMNAAFGTDDTPDEDAISRLKSIDSSVDDMANEFMSGVDALVDAGLATQTDLPDGARSIEPTDDMRVVHLHTLEAPNLTPADLDDLAALVKDFVSERAAQKNAAGADQASNE
jgi:hypothetical protein